MTQKEFIKILDNKNIKYVYDGRILKITDENSYVDLHDIKYLPENIIFNNLAGIDLYSLIAFPKHIVFNNISSIHIKNMNTLYDGKITCFKNVKNYTMILGSFKKLNDFKIYKADDFVGNRYPLKHTKYVIEKNGFTTSTTESIRLAIDILEFEIFASINQRELINDIKKRKFITAREIGLILQRNQEDLQDVMLQNKIELKEKYDLDYILDICEKLNVQNCKKLLNLFI